MSTEFPRISERDDWEAIDQLGQVLPLDQQRQWLDTPTFPLDRLPGTLARVREQCLSCPTNPSGGRTRLRS